MRLEHNKTINQSETTQTGLPRLPSIIDVAAGTSPIPVPQINEELAKMLGKSLDDLTATLGNKLYPKTLEKLRLLAEEDGIIRQTYGMSILDYAFQMHHGGYGLKDVAISLNVSPGYLADIFDKLGLPHLNRHEANKRLKEGTPEEIYKARMAHAKDSLSHQQKSDMSKEREARFSEEYKTERGKIGARAALAKMTTEEIRERIARMQAKIDKELWSKRAREQWDALTPQQQQEKIYQLKAGLTDEVLQRNAEMIRKTTRNMTPEQLKARGRKARATYVANTTQEQRNEAMESMRNARTAEERSQTMKRMWQNVPPEERGNWGRQIYPSTLGRFTSEQKAQFGIVGRLSTDFKPNKTEQLLIDVLGQSGLYSESVKDAKPGQIYFGDSLENKTAYKLENGRWVFPDFIVFGTDKVIEVYGDFWHSEDYCKKKGYPDYRWNIDLMVEEYAKIGVECLIFKAKELKNPEIREEILYLIKDWIKEST